MRKQVLGKITKIEKSGPRLGETITHIYRNVTHLAKDKWCKNVKEAWQYVYTFFIEDCDKYIKERIASELPHISNNLDVHENMVVVKYSNGKIILYYDYDMEKELLEFEIRRLV